MSPAWMIKNRQAGVEITATAGAFPWARLWLVFEAILSFIPHTRRRRCRVGGRPSPRYGRRCCGSEGTRARLSKPQICKQQSLDSNGLTPSQQPAPRANTEKASLWDLLADPSEIIHCKVRTAGESCQQMCVFFFAPHNGLKITWISHQPWEIRIFYGSDFS